MVNMRRGDQPVQFDPGAVGYGLSANDAFNGVIIHIASIYKNACCQF
jgi:hypothetical protein